MVLDRTRIVLKVDTVDPNEGCYNLSELDQQSPGNHGWHRYQIIIVVRNDTLAEYREDLGPRTNFPNSNQFRISGYDDPNGWPCNIIETVGRLKAFAEDMRNNPFVIQAPSLDLVQGYWDAMEMKQGSQHDYRNLYRGIPRVSARGR